MKQLVAVVNLNDKDEILSDLEEYVTGENISLSHVKSVETHIHSYIYRGRKVNNTSTVAVDKLELSCLTNRNNEEQIKSKIAGFTNNFYDIELSEAWDIDTVARLEHSESCIAFVIPVEDKLIGGIYGELYNEGYEIARLNRLPDDINAIIHYDAIVIDMSVRRYSTEELAPLLNLSSGVPLVLLNRSQIPLDKIMYIRAGFHNIYEVRDDHTISTTIMALAAQYRDTRKQLVKGSLNNQDSLFSIVQLLAMQAKTGELMAMLDNNTLGHIYFERGNIINARYRNYKGEKALFRIFAHTPLGYQVVELQQVITPAISRSLMEILMEVSRRDDTYYKHNTRREILNRKLSLKSGIPDEPLLIYFTEPKSIAEICDVDESDDVEIMNRLLELIDSRLLG